MVILTKMLSFVTSNIRNKFCLQKLKFYTIKFNYYFHTSRILPNNRSAPSRAKKNPFPVSRTSTTQKDTCLSQCLIHQEITSIETPHNSTETPNPLRESKTHNSLSLRLFAWTPSLSRAIKMNPSYSLSLAIFARRTSLDHSPIAFISIVPSVTWGVRTRFCRAELSRFFCYCLQLVD